MKKAGAAASFAWLMAAVYYFYQYVLRSAPAVMLPQLSDAFSLSSVAVASMMGVFYYGYSACSLIAGTAVDGWGAKAVLPPASVVTRVGALLFATGDLAAANVGRILQGAGGAFALVGAIYIASENFPASRAATLTGAAQMFGMAGGSAGQILVGPLIEGGLSWKRFWMAMALAGVATGIAVFFFLPGRTLPERTAGFRSVPSQPGLLTALSIVFRNPQTLLCGVTAGLLFIPTTVFDMVSGVRYLQEARGFDYGDAVMRSATLPIGWMIGCPLLRMLSDRVGRRPPVIAGGAFVLLACLAWILYGLADVLPSYMLGLTAGLASGASMLTYTVSKEANPPHLSGTATGVVSFLNLTFSALVGPVFGMDYEACRNRADRTSGALSNNFPISSVRRRACGPVNAGVERDRAGGACSAGNSRGGNMNPGTGKYESLLERCASLAALPAAVAHPCEVSALAGALEAGEKGLITPILVGPAAKIQEIARSANLVLGVAEIVDVPHSHASAAKAVELVREGKAELLMKGSLHSDELLAAVVARDAGLRTGRRISHVFIMDVPAYHKVLVVTDAGINIAPTLEDKVDICQNAIDLVISLGPEAPEGGYSRRSRDGDVQNACHN